MRILVFITVAVALAYPASGQNCTCESNFEWLKKTFEENDAGFQYIIDKKGQAAYDAHNQLTFGKITSAKTLPECAVLLQEWLQFFRSLHIGIQLLTDDKMPVSQNRREVVEEKIDSPEYEHYINSKNAQNPYLETLNSTTLYLRIPSFDGRHKKSIDDVLLANKEKILSTENLIIDLRNNGGGSDVSFDELLPFLYTNPVRKIEALFLSTTLNNQRMLELINNAEQYGLDEKLKQWAQQSYDKLEKHLGEFINLEDEDITIDRRDTIYTYPKNIGIIIHERNGSTTENFLLAARQSKKVKLFGTTTVGALDISNMYWAISPCEEIALIYGLSKSLRIPDMAIDGIGVQPDYYLDKTIPQYKWVEFVNEILNQ